MRLFHLESELWLPQPIDRVFAFFADARNLERITPAFLRFSVVTPAPIEMKVGTLIDYRLRVHGLPLRWRSEIAAWQPPYLFIDEQRRGPYRKWVHRHVFEPRDGGTLVCDQVEYAHIGGRCVNRWFVRPDLEKIFAHRSEVLKEIFESNGDHESPVAAQGDSSAAAVVNG